jgi:transcriptional regulator with XRE-family HTH domain
MQEFYKTPEQIEFKEIFDSLEESIAMSRAQLARELKVDAAYITMILGGKRSPSKRTMSDLRSLKARADPNYKSVFISPDGKELPEQLEYLRKHAPGKFESARQIIHALHESAIGGVSSKVAAVAAASQSDAAVEARKLSQSSPPKPAVAAPTAHKRKPKPDAGRETSPPPGVVKQSLE